MPASCYAQAHDLPAGRQGLVMPKKSKREKMIADMRRQDPAAHPEMTSSEASQDLTLIKRDITKIVVLAALAVSAELLLYWRM